MRPFVKVVPAVLIFCMMMVGKAFAGVYTNSEYGFSMNQPEGWEKTEFSGQDDGVVLVFHGPDGALLMVRMVQESVNLIDDVGRDAVLNGFLDTLQNSGMRDIALLDEGVAVVGGEQGYGMHYSYSLPGGAKIENASTFIAGPDRYFIITYAAVPTVYEQFAKTMGDTVKSFRIESREREMAPTPGGKYIYYYDNKILKRRHSRESGNPYHWMPDRITRA
ncbi:MAG: PsbP-related protein [Nitrospirota bacterium]|nr:PsbP-related protein [Nitrospirota bacterium]